MTAPSLEGRIVLVVEDGEEYIEALRHQLRGPMYRRATTLDQALEQLADGRVDLVFLDMKFDRIAPEALAGRDDTLHAQMGFDDARVTAHLQDHQGLFILSALDRALADRPPVVFAHDFSRMPERFRRLAANHDALSYVEDAIDADQLRSHFLRVLAA